MTKLALTILLLLSTSTWAASPNPADYTINVHVNTSRMKIEYDGNIATVWQELNVLIGGKKYELRSDRSLRALLELGDYKARLVKDEHNSSYDSYQAYEFLFPDNKTRQFDVVGQSE